MSYTCTIYQNSGLNATNTIDNGALLNSLPQITVPALDIVQERLNSITVKATWDQVKNADFCKLSNGTTNIFFAIDGAGITMNATDVAVLPVTLDYLLTYGIGTILDGITERVHVKDDSYGLYTEDDPLLNAENPLLLSIQKMAFDDGKNYNIFIESTLNPLVTQKNVGAARYSYSVTGEDPSEVTVPLARYNEAITTYTIGNVEANINPGTCIYSMGNQSGIADAMMDAVAFLRSLGLEQAVIRQVALPSSFCEVTQDTKESKAAYGEGTQKGTAISYPYISNIRGKILTNTPSDSNFNFELYKVKNNVINYSPLIKYGLITSAGESAEFTPADLKEGTTGDAPVVQCVADPHLDGRPYYRFETVNGDNSLMGFWRNCIGGMNWKNVPLIYEKPSGETITKMQFVNQQAIRQIGYSYQQAGAIRGAAAGTAGDINAAAQNWKAASNYIDIGGSLDPATFSSRYDVGNIAGNISGVLNAANNVGGRALNYMAARQLNQAQRTSELSELGFNIATKAPSVNFPFSSEIMRDFYGNDVYMYRYRYSDMDVQRIDKLLTMYGYKVSKPLELTDFNNRRFFNFVMCNNVTVGGHAKWINDGISEQLRAGVRIWHELPNTARYTDNPIKGV